MRGCYQGRIQYFKLGGKGALKKIAPGRGRRENFWGIIALMSPITIERGVLWVCYLYVIYTVYGSLSKYTHIFLFIFWWHQIFSFPFCFSLLVFPTLQWHIYIIRITIIFYFPKNNYFMLVTPRTERYEGVLPGADPGFQVRGGGRT
jgi:hypothetical protein